MKRISVLISIFFLVFALKAQNVWQTELLNKVNELRKSGCRCGGKYYAATTPLVWNTQLELAATNHATDMSVKKYFNHKSKMGTILENASKPQVMIGKIAEKILPLGKSL